MFMLTPQRAQANDYLEHSEHYTVMNMGNGVYRFTIPIWVYGRANDYYLDSYNARNGQYDSYIWYSLKPNQERGANDVHRIATVAAVRYGLNDKNDYTGEGEGFIYMHTGSAVIQNLKDGTKLPIPQDDDTYWDQWTNSLKLKRKNDDGHVNITYIEFDWYPPQELAGKNFYWGVSANIYKKYSGESCYTKWWKMSDRLNMTDPQTPELFTPYLYALDEEGVTGYGNAAVQYVTYQQGVSYHTSLNPNEVGINENSGAIIVPTADTVQRQFNATFRVNLTNDSTNPQIFTLKTNAVNIPAYHRIYDFSAEEVLDEQQSVTGKVKLKWAIRFPGAEDLVSGDVFQVERALEKDFSDAQSIRVQSFDVDSANYSYEDDPTSVLIDANSSTEQKRRMSEEGTFYAKDTDGNTKIQYYARLTSNKVYEPGKTVYYRVRRGSSAIWGWHEPYAQKTELKKNNYLAPLAEQQEAYTKDPDWDNNRLVHFNIKLENKAVTQQPEAESQCELKTYIQHIDGMIPIRLHVTGSGGVNPADYQYKLYYLPSEGTLQQTMLSLQDGNILETEVESGSMVQISVINSQGYSVNTLNLIGKLDDQAAYIADWELYPGSGSNLYDHTYEDETAMQTALDQLTAQYPLPDSARHVLYTKIEQKTTGLNASNTYRNWDRNAIIYLQRIAVETNDTIEFTVPADSIKRQADGSWIAHTTNIVDQSCLHYRYAVRIDQTGSVLKVLDPAELLPVAIDGPDLYYNEVADIARFDASQGTDRYGVILTWEPTPGGLDFYELSRREAGSTAEFEPVKTTEETNYRDDDAVPGKEYEYRLMASFSCNDTTTTSFATTTGFRSPYGLISGRIHYSDGTGCPDIKVGLEGEGISGLETVTDGAGRFVFDSLLYGEGKEYHITPVSTYAEFRYNNTTATSTSTTLDAENPVASGIEFDNISSVRFSGRVLYSKSTIPVRDANILLDSTMVYSSGGPLRTNASGNFELQVPKDHPFTIQVVKDGHRFEGDGFVRMNNDSNLVLDKALDGVRIWDATKVKLAGRLVGGVKQAEKALGFGLSKNNLGDDLQLVLELEGDNISQIVRDEDDLTRDTFEYTVPHIVRSFGGAETQTGETHMLYQKKRIIIRPDSLTGEYCAEIFPVKYKITQATARGYATLFAEGKTSDVIDLSNAATYAGGDAYEDKIFQWNEKYSITYRSPIDISCIQMRYGTPMPYYGEEYMSRQNVLNEQIQIPLAEKDSTGQYHYTFGAPVFPTANYTFRITAHEDYYYNNDKNSTQHEEVRINGGKMMVYNGMHASEETQTFSGLFPKWEQATQTILKHSRVTNTEGQIDITIPIDYVSFNQTGDDALRVLNVSVESDGRYIEKQVLRGYVTGSRWKGTDYMAKIKANVDVMDILRDPPGAKSYAYLESGSSFNYSYTWNVKLDFGAKLNFKYGSGQTFVFGNFLGAAPGTPSAYSGYVMNASVANTYAIPITTGFDWKRGGSYTFTTNQRIETGSDNWFVGSRGDIYIGLTQGLLLQLADAVKPLDSLTYSTLKAQMKENVGVTGNGATVAEGRSLAGEKYYLTIGEEIGTSVTVDGTFVYSQDYIVTVLLPQLIKERDALLVTGDSATVQAIADVKGTEVYWSTVLPTDTTYALTNYKKIIPTGDSEKMWIDVDRVAEYNTTIKKWLDLIAKNEEEKINVLGGNKAEHIGNYSVSNGVKMSYSNTYDAVGTYSWKWTGLGSGLTGNFETLFVSQDLKGMGNEMKEMRNLFQTIYNNNGGDGNQGSKGSPFTLNTKLPTAETTFEFTPILDLDWDRDPVETKTYTRTAGFVLEPDEYSYMNVDVFRRKEESNDFNKTTDEIRERVDDGLELDYESEDHLYGSFVYRLNGGATKCPWEGPEESIFYSKGGRPVQMSSGTLKLEVPTIEILNHEVSDIPHDQPAIIHIRLSNETQQTFESYVVFKLVLVDASNPLGAKVLMDGFPLTGDGRSIKLNPGQTIDKTLEVYAGQGYDFENLTLMLASQCDILNFAKASFSVHYQPTSCDVNISTPHDKWVMNTLSPKDSTGWYLPVVIDGYDINYPNFDHIEFQYKLSKQSDDGWVNLCSYYVDSTLYQNASGSKALMGPGRIENIAFYGERDPMEQLYDLRAVSFCRYGTSYLTKSSPVLTGIKDTRVPRVFGEPEPANSILGVGDNLKLRFNEPIAGNYLDEDNNFQITGITNEIGMSAATALHFDGNDVAYTKAKRDLTDRSFTLDMMIRPTVANNRANDMILFETGDGKVTKQLILTKDNRLRLVKKVGNAFLAKTSKPMESLMAFQRIIVVSDKQNSRTRFFAGTVDITDHILGDANDQVEEGSSAYFRFGEDYDGDMLETRIWTKALTVEEIAATANHSLTGYERELLAYYRMDEGKGETVTDQAHGATLYLDGCSWNKQKGYSLRLDGEPVRLNGNLLGRSAAYDETMLFWFKAESEGTLFSAARHEATDSTAATGTLLALENGGLALRSGGIEKIVNHKCADGEWHHLVLTISRTYNHAALFLDGAMLMSMDANELEGITGAMSLGGNGFKGLIDEFAIFEQALPQSLVETYETIALSGDEMGLMAYLPFDEQYSNPNGILEQRFTINDKRIFKDPNGNIVNKIVPLLLNNQPSLADPSNAPIRSHGLLNKLYFDWSFNNDELMVNILNRSYEINKQPIYVTVRDVEDLNGNPMASPVTWTAFVDRNSLKWSDRELSVKVEDSTEGEEERTIRIINHSGKRHTYQIESLPAWLSVDRPYGAIDPMGEQTIRLTFNRQITIGEHSDIIYLTDEEGLSEPLRIEYEVEALPPYDEVEEGLYPYNMSVCAQVKLLTESGLVYDTDDRDIVYALFRNQCVGKANVSVNALSNTSDVYLTVMGNEEMTRKEIVFQLWQASTGKTLNLTPSEKIVFAQGAVYGCGSPEPIILSTSASEMQTIELAKGWNWISFNLDLQPATAPIVKVLSAKEPWTEGDIIKNPATQHFVTYSEINDAFIGDFSYLRFIYTYMVYSGHANTMCVNGNHLPADSMHITVRGDGSWSALPCLLNTTTHIAEALADYYDDATPGDMIKARNRFAYFSNDKQWVGDLTALRPGEGYFFKRTGKGDVDVRFFDNPANAPTRKALPFGEHSEAGFSNPKAATNMTMIAVINGENGENGENGVLKVYIGSELVGVATQIDSLYFLTIQSDQVGELRFETEDGTELVSEMPLFYEADSHHGSVQSPIVLKHSDNRVYKLLEDNHIVIIRNNEKYDITGKRLNK